MKLCSRGSARKGAVPCEGNLRGACGLLRGFIRELRSFQGGVTSSGKSAPECGTARICFRARRTGNGQNGDGRRGVRGSGNSPAQPAIAVGHRLHPRLEARHRMRCMMSFPSTRAAAVASQDNRNTGITPLFLGKVRWPT